MLKWQTKSTTSMSNIKPQITRIVRGIRRNEYNWGSCTTTVQSTLDDAITEKGVPMKRRRIVLTAHGCCVSTCTMCPLPDESVPDDIEITDINLKQQIDQATENSEDCDVLTVYHNGNFFADKELSDEVREHIYKKVASLNFKSLVVECLPQFITKEKLDKAKALLSGKTIQVAIGLQSWDDVIREIAINSTCTKKKFLEANKLLNEYEYSAQVFLMFKPPFLTIKESINDLVNGVVELKKLGINDPIICPMRISKNTVVDVLFNLGEYTSPTLWQLVEAVEKIHELVPDTNCRIAISCLTGADGIQAIRTQGCPKCSKLLIEAFTRYNHSHDILDVQSVTCECKSKKMVDLDIKIPILQRVKEFAEKYENRN